MDENTILLALKLTQLKEVSINNLILAYQNSDKEKFDISKLEILDLQKKIDLILK